MLSQMGKTGQESGGDSCGTNSALTTSASKLLGGQAAGVCVCVCSVAGRPNRQKNLSRDVLMATEGAGRPTPRNLILPGP